MMCLEREQGDHWRGPSILLMSLSHSGDCQKCSADPCAIQVNDVLLGKETKPRRWMSPRNIHGEQNFEGRKVTGNGARLRGLSRNCFIQETTPIHLRLKWQPLIYARMDGWMGFYGSANTGMRYMGARREARDRGYPLLFSIYMQGGRETQALPVKQANVYSL